MDDSQLTAELKAEARRLGFDRRRRLSGRDAPRA